MELFCIERGCNSRTEIWEREMEWKLCAYPAAFSTRTCLLLPLSSFPPPPFFSLPPSNAITRAAGLRSHFRLPPTLPQRIIDRFWQPRPKSRMASILETVSMVAEFGQQQWSCTNFRCSDRTLRSRDRIFEFSQEMVKICAAAWILDTRGNFDRSCGTTSRYSTGETPPIKAERPEPSDHLRSPCLRINTSTRIWTRALQPDQEEVSSWRFCRAQIVSGRQTFLLKFWLGEKFYLAAEILPRRWDFNVRHSSIVRLNFYQAPKFCIPA